MKTQSMSIRQFMSSDYTKENTKIIGNTIKRVGISIAVPMFLAKPAFAAAPTVVTAGATQYISAKTLEIIAHALDPLVDLMVALSFPISSIIIIGSCFFFMLGKSERAWSGIQNAGLGYILIQIMPLLLNVLKEIGGSI